MGKYFYNKDFFEKINSEEKAYWLGFIYADGCINQILKNERIKSMDLEIGLSRIDEGHLIKFLNSIESNVPIKYRSNKLNGKMYESCRVVICCTKLCKDLIKLGCTPRKSLTLKFPSSDILPKEYVGDFIRGYFDGDGCINLRKECNTMRLIFVGTVDFLTSIKNILIDNGVLRSCPNMTAKGNAFQMTINGVDNIIDIYDFMYKNKTIYLDRKYKKYTESINKISDSRQNNVSQKRGVYYDKRIDKWIVTICLNGVRKTIGAYKKLEDAINERKRYEIYKLNNAE